MDRLTIIICAFLLSLQGRTQSPEADSLLNVWENDNFHDTTRLSALRVLVTDVYLYTNPDSAEYYGQIRLNYARKKGYPNHEASALKSIGTSHVLRGSIDKAMNYYDEGIEIFRALGDREQVANIYNNMGVIYQRTSQFEKAIEYHRKSLKIKLDMGLSVEAGSSYMNIGTVHGMKGENEKALQNFETAISLFKKKENYKEISAAYNNIANVYRFNGDLRSAIDYYHRSLKAAEKSGSKPEIADALNNIGSVYELQEDLDQALDYFNRALKLREEFGDRYGIGSSLINIGSVQLIKKNYDEAKMNYKRAAEIAEEIQNYEHLAYAQTNLGLIELNQGNYAASLPYFEASMEIAKALQNPELIGTNLDHLAAAYLGKGNYSKGREFAEEAVQLSRESGHLRNLRNSSYTMYKAYKYQDQFGKALEAYKTYVDARDSIQSRENQQEIMRREFAYEYEKKSIEDSIESAKSKKIQNARIARQKAELKQRKQDQMFLYGGIAFVTLFLVFMVNRFQVARKQKKLIEKQKEEVSIQRDNAEQLKSEAEMQRAIVEDKNKEILDSINYAKRLQDAILPAPKVVKEYLGESFILYKPKDIVAGDFYWMETYAEASDAKGWTYIAAADCTGHGVPGAMVSVVCSNALSKALVEEGITDTGKLLDRTRELVIERFGKSDAEIKDGMDISLAAIRHDGKQVRWSGANNPLWVVKGERSKVKGDPLSELLQEFKADKQPIGKYAHSKPFTQHTIDIDPGDTLYMFSDGYSDQFGGHKGKKFKTANLKKMLISIQGESMESQRQILEEEFEKWRGELEQIDDVCIIGVKL